MPDGGKKSVKEFATAIKGKYPQYADMDDFELSQKMVEKYPQYAEQVELKKKEDTSLLDGLELKGNTLSDFKTLGENLQQSATEALEEKEVNLSQSGSLGLEKLGDAAFSEAQKRAEKGMRHTRVHPDKPDETFKKIGGEWYQLRTDEEKALEEKNIALSTGASFKDPLKSDIAPKVSPWKKISDAPTFDQLEYEFLNKDVTSEGYKKARVVDTARKKVLKDVDSTFKKFNKSESDIVPSLQESLKQAGEGVNIFKVEEYGAGYDALKITNRLTGEYKTVRLGMGDQSDIAKAERDILKNFIDYGVKTSDYGRAKHTLEKLRKRQIEQDKNPVNYDPLLPAKIEKAQEKLDAFDKERRQIVKDNPELYASMYNKVEAKNINTDVDMLIQEGRELKESITSDVEWINETIQAKNDGLISDEQWEAEYQPKIEAMRSKIQVSVKGLENKESDLVQKSTDINHAAASNYLVQKDRGGIIGGATKSFAHGAGSVIGFIVHDTGVDEYGDTFADRFAEEWSPGIVTKEYLSAADRSAFEKIIFGLSESVGASVTGSALTAGLAGSAGGFMGLYANSYSNFRAQMDSPEFDDVPEYEKMLMSAAYGSTVGMLEKFGLGKAFSKSPVGKGLVGKILGKTFKEVPKNPSPAVIKELLENNTRLALTEKGLQIGGAALIEGSTEAGQEIFDQELKFAYNQMKGKEYFDSPKTGAEMLSQVGESMVMGMAGGAMMNTASQAGRAMVNGFGKGSGLNTIDSDIMKSMSTTEELRNLFESNLKVQVASGEITEAQAKRKLDQLDAAAGVYNKMPDNMTPENEAKAFPLVIEKSQLEVEIEGKEKSMVTEQVARIEEIDAELAVLSGAKPKYKNEAEEISHLESIIEIDDNQLEGGLESRLKKGQRSEILSRLEELKKPKKDAVQKQESSSVDVGKQAADGSKVESRTSKPKDKQPTKEDETKKEKVKDESEITEEGSEIEDETKDDDNFTGKTYLSSKKDMAINKL